MRNVNDIEVHKSKLGAWSYSLTMRNVNKRNLGIWGDSNEMLFINYEECKCFFEKTSNEVAFQLFINYEECKF